MNPSKHRHHHTPNHQCNTNNTHPNKPGRGCCLLQWQPAERASKADSRHARPDPGWQQACRGGGDPERPRWPVWCVCVLRASPTSVRRCGLHDVAASKPCCSAAHPSSFHPVHVRRVPASSWRVQVGSMRPRTTASPTHAPGASSTPSTCTDTTFGS